MVPCLLLVFLKIPALNMTNLIVALGVEGFVAALDWVDFLGGKVADLVGGCWIWWRICWRVWLI